MVADYAEAEVDIRYWSLAEDTRISNEILKLIPKNPGTKLNIKQIFSCPPMDANPSISMLFDRVKKIGKKINLDLCESSSGGGSGANFASSQGIPTLDGLGAIGDGVHSNTEYINIDSLSIRVSLLALIIQASCLITPKWR
jgi:glutamate carboxypeptidase